MKTKIVHKHTHTHDDEEANEKKLVTNDILERKKELQHMHTQTNTFAHAQKHTHTKVEYKQHARAHIQTTHRYK